MSDPVYSLITDLEGNGPCMAPYPYANSLLVAMITPCPFADGDVDPDSVYSLYDDSTLSYGRGFLKATTTNYLAHARIAFRLKHNGVNRTIRLSKSANSNIDSSRYQFKVNDYAAHVWQPLDSGDHIIVPPYYRYQLRIDLWVRQQTTHQADYEEIWVKAEIL